MEILDAEALASEFRPYQLRLSPTQLSQVGEYLALLLRWNRRLSLTALRDPRRIVRDLFAESMYLATLVPLSGCLVDIASGAGFPGLALKLVAPALQVALIESNGRKCTFLKEAARLLRLSSVTVAHSRIDSYAVRHEGVADIVTTRAVKLNGALLLTVRRLLSQDGQVFVFVGAGTAQAVVEIACGLEWGPPLHIPFTERRVILVGRRLT